MNKLNIGCGRDYKKGYINIDNNPLCKVDKLVDIEKGLFFRDNYFDKVIANHVLEHIHDKEYDFVIEEIYRVSKPHAKVIINCPHFASGAAFLDDHKRFYSTIAFYKYLKKNNNSPRNKGFGHKVLFKMVKVHIGFPGGFNPLNYFEKTINFSTWTQRIYENTFLKSIFIPDWIRYELVVLK